jgi:hypothetical protein
MSLRFFEGPAGSGKTTQLFTELAAMLDQRPVKEHERVLALTKMHGSRRRMQSRLLGLHGLRNRFECATMDSFAWRVARRWRSLASAKGFADVHETDYAEICRRAGALMAHSVVRQWLVRAFPFVVVDEAQDSNDGQLDIIRALSMSATCLVAADDYQDLDASGENAAVAWARQNGEIVSLSHNHRTSAGGLLAAASALREGRAVPANGNGFVVLGAHNHNTGAGHVSRNLTWWSGCGDIAVITPVRTGTSPFVQNLIARVEQGPIGNPAVGPHRIPWESSQEDECLRFLSGLGLPADPSVQVSGSELGLCDQGGISRALLEWLQRQRRLGGKTTFAVSEIRQQVEVIHHRSRAFRRLLERGVRAMTIHQAKNREFESVIVLWPYEVAGSADRQRRLLYNAITRAKRQALVIVQNPQRLQQPPFVPA